MEAGGRIRQEGDKGCVRGAAGIPVVSSEVCISQEPP